jgi:hypothetical protein
MHASLLFLVSTATAQPQYNSTELAEIYINLGSLDHNPEKVDCNLYTKLFAPNAVKHTPGAPDAVGQPAINNACQTSHGQVNPLISFQELNIRILNWQGKPRVAFRWTINGERTKDKYLVSAPAISHIFQDSNGSITEAYSFYDTSLITGSGSPTPVPESIRDIASQFSRFGSVEPVPVGACSAFADMFADDGTWHLPGLPDYSGADSIQKACQTAIHGPWNVVVPSIQSIIPGSSWSNAKTFAMRWTIAGESASSHGVIIPSISIISLDANDKIVDAWAYYDEASWPKA